MYFNIYALYIIISYIMEINIVLNVVVVMCFYDAYYTYFSF